MFDSLKKSLGIKDKQQSTGHVLGTGKKETAVDNNYQEEAYRLSSEDCYTFDVTFHEEKLGMGVDEQRGLPVVSSVTAGSAAHKSGILVGDTVIALENNPLTNFDSFFTFMQVIGRPVTITFQRRKPNQNTVSSTMKNFMNAMPTISLPKVTSSKPPPEELSEEEKQARREMMSRAANDRTQQWDKKLGTNKLNRAKSKEADVAKNGTGLTADEDALKSSNPETQRVIEKTKALELNVERSMGYNPFKPHMSFSSGAGAGMPSPPNGSQPGTPLSPPSVPASNTANNTTAVGAASMTAAQLTPDGVLRSGNNVGLSADEYEDFLSMMVSEVDDSFAMLLSLGQDQQEVAKVAVQTVHKMLLNLFNNKSDLKLRSIRVSNKVFQSKVATVPGGIEMLLAAGYSVVDKSDTAAGTTDAAVDDSNTPKEGSASDGNINLFLVHSMDAVSEKKLSYTLARIKELFSDCHGC